MSNNQGETSLLSEDIQIAKLVPFWSAFCLSYCPRSADYESKQLERRLLCFFVPAFCKAAGANVGLNYVIEADISFVTSSVETICFVLINAMYLRHEIKRPFISNRPSAQFGDVFNDAEIITTRLLCWSAILFLVQAASVHWSNLDFFGVGGYNYLSLVSWRFDLLSGSVV